jgi:L-alanine-DL-glutamate epimerase-like enolase superfamily enzyme
MAHEAGLLCTPHMSGSGLGYLDAAHFASIIPNPVAFTEYKGSADVPVTSETSSLKVEGGMVRVPSGPGFGVTIDPAFVGEAVPVKAI